MGRRVLITGLATFWGGLVAQRLEADPTVDVIIGLDTRELIQFRCAGIRICRCPGEERSEAEATAEHEGPEDRSKGRTGDPARSGW